MRTENAPTVRLADYAPPDFLADEIALSFRLAPRGARVRARVSVPAQPRGEPGGGPAARRPGAAAGLGGDRRGGGAAERAGGGRRGADGGGGACAGRLRLGGGDRDRPGGEHRARGALHVARHVLHPVRGAGVPQDHLLAGPARRDGALPGADRGRRAGPAVERQPRGVGAGLGRVGGPVPEAVLPVRAGGGRPRRGRGPVRHHVRARGAAADLGAGRRRGPLRLRDGRAEAVDAVGRGGLRAGVRPRPLHDRRGRRLQHGGDGEQGAQRLQLEVRAGEPRDRDRRRLQVDRGDHRARVFPQLDRQPDHLPRLVPALAQGGADGLPRPAVLRRHALARRSSASRT